MENKMFKEIWTSPEFDKRRFNRVLKGMGVPSPTIRNWASGFCRPSKASGVLVLMGLQEQGITAGDFDTLFPKDFKYGFHNYTK